MVFSDYYDSELSIWDLENLGRAIELLKNDHQPKDSQKFEYGFPGINWIEEEKLSQKRLLWTDGLFSCFCTIGRLYDGETEYALGTHYTYSNPANPAALSEFKKRVIQGEIRKGEFILLKMPSDKFRDSADIYEKLAQENVAEIKRLFPKCDIKALDYGTEGNSSCKVSLEIGEYHDLLSIKERGQTTPKTIKLEKLT